jgi:hypothetical protein
LSMQRLSAAATLPHVQKLPLNIVWKYAQRTHRRWLAYHIWRKIFLYVFSEGNLSVYHKMQKNEKKRLFHWQGAVSHSHSWSPQWRHAGRSFESRVRYSCKIVQRWVTGYPDRMDWRRRGCCVY